MSLVDAQWLSVPDVARRLNKSTKTVLRTIRRGELVAYKLDERTYSVTPAALEAFIESRRCVGAAESEPQGVCG
jgi:excisionase family DNA binding protein